MAFKELSNEVRYPKYKECIKGDLIVEGEYIGEGTSEKFGTPQYKFRDNDGMVVLGGAGQLNYFMKQAKPGNNVRVTYDGTFLLTQGKFAGTEAHNFKVAVDDGEEETF